VEITEKACANSTDQEASGKKRSGIGQRRARVGIDLAVKNKSDAARSGGDLDFVKGTWPIATGKDPNTASPDTGERTGVLIWAWGGPHGIGQPRIAWVLTADR